MQAKWDEMFGEKTEERREKEEVKVKKPRKKAVMKKKGESDKKKDTVKKARTKKKIYNFLEAQQKTAELGSLFEIVVDDLIIGQDIIEQISIGLTLVNCQTFLEIIRCNDS